MAVKNRNSFNLIDALILLLHLFYGMSMLKVWLIDPIPISGFISLIIITSIAYVFRFGLSFSLLKTKHNAIAVLFLVLYLADIMQNIFFDINQAITRFLLLVDVFLFMEYVFSLYLECKKINDNPINNVTKYFEYYIAYNLVAIFLCLALIIMGVLSSTGNPMHENSLLSSNISTGGHYYFPGYLSLATGNQRGLSLFNLPVLTGLSHEPHVLFLLAGPCFFFFLNRVANRAYLLFTLYILYFALLIISTSTTAILSFIIAFAIDQLYNVFIGSNKRRSIIVLVLIAGVVALFLSKGASIMDDVLAMMETKMEADEDVGSKGFSLTMLNYMITPESVFGRGNMPDGTGFALINQDIGYLTFILDFIFVFAFVVKTIKCVFSSDRHIHYYGMALLYFFIHNMKMSVQAFSFQYVSFWVILLVIIENEMSNKYNPKFKLSKK